VEVFKDGKLNAYKLPTGTVIVREEESQGSEQSVAIYCRVSSSENKGNLESQKSRLLDYCAAKGYKGEQGYNRSRFRDKRHPQAVAVFTARPDGKDYCSEA